MYCKFCGRAIDYDSCVCPYCGHQLRNVTVLTTVGRSGPKNKWIAFLLCLFLGGLGAHKFYEGKYLFGIIYLLTIGLFGFGWLFDTIALLLKPNPYYV